VTARGALNAAITGVLFAWLVLILMAFHQPKIYDVRIFGVAMLFGALFAVVVRAVISLTSPADTSMPRAIGCGCAYAFTAFLFFGFIGAIAAMFTKTSFVIDASRTPWPVLVTLLTIGGLGVFGGVQFARVRRAEAERQSAALERQQLELARDLQKRLLPPEHFDSDRFRIEAKNIAAAYVAGDFYDFVPLPNDRVLIVIADVAGKGLAAGLIVATVKAMIPLIASAAESPDEILREINSRIAPNLSKREFVAMIIAIFDATTGALSIANAGLPDPLLVRADVVPLVVEGPRYPIGVRSSIEYLSIAITLDRGDRVLFFTDGLPEAGIDGEPVGYQRLAELALRARGDIPTLFMALEAMTTETREDDWTAVSLERL
jgi:hypothetical protein